MLISPEIGQSSISYNEAHNRGAQAFNVVRAQADSVDTKCEHNPSSKNHSCQTTSDICIVDKDALTTLLS